MKSENRADDLKKSFGCVLENGWNCDVGNDSEGIGVSDMRYSVPMMPRTSCMEYCDLLLFDLIRRDLQFVSLLRLNFEGYRRNTSYLLKF